MRIAPVAPTVVAKPAERPSELQPQGHQQQADAGTDHQSGEASPQKGNHGDRHSDQALQKAKTLIQVSGLLSLKQLPFTPLKDLIIAERSSLSG